MQAEDTEPVEGEESNPESGVAEPSADTTPKQLANTVPKTPAEKPQEVIPLKQPKMETESEQSQEPVSQPPAQQESAKQ